MARAARLQRLLRTALRRPFWLYVLVTACAGDRITGPTPHALPVPISPTVRPCVGERTFFAGTALANRESWYGKQLRAMDEQAFCSDSSYILESYRFTWIPSFHPAVVVRIDLTATGYLLTAKILNGAGGYEPGSLAREVVHTLSDVDRTRFSELLRAAKFWELPTNVPLLGCDGAQWVLEALTSKGYHVVDRWTPDQQGPDLQFRALGEWMLASSGLAPTTLVKE